MHTVVVFMKVIPIPASAGITGFESPAAEYNQLDLSLDELLVERPSSTFLGFANGDSMIELGIFDGDLLIVDRFPVAQHNDVIVANFNGEFICKVLDMTNRQLLSANSKYSSVTITENDQFTIEGIVVRSIRMFRKSYLLSA
jgi:DNA polymerase V